MEVDKLPVMNGIVKCCECGCTCNPLMNRSLSGTALRSVKRKACKFQDQGKFVIPGLSGSQVARIEIENEVDVLRETVTNQQETIQDLCCELEQERSASSSAANEAMSMIVRLQGEKAEIQMESRQFKRYAEEKMAHDQQEISSLEEVLYKREQTIQSLTFEVQSYKHKLLSYGIIEGEDDVEGGPGSRIMSRNNSYVEDEYFDDQLDFPAYDYPQLKCNLNENHVYSEADVEVPYDVEKYAFEETPRSSRHLKDLEFRINQLERTPSNIPSESPRHLRNFSTSTTGTVLKETEYTDSPKFGSIKKRDAPQLEEYSNLKKSYCAAGNGDNATDRVYTIDSINQNAPYVSVAETKASTGFFDDYMMTPRESQNPSDLGNPEIKKMYMRLQALEADRESMRQAVISMRTDKAQFVLLKEIAQHLCKEMPPQRSPVVARPSVCMSVCKLIISFVFWKNKARRCRYMFGKSPHSAGLLMLLDKGQRVGHWRCFSRVQM